MSSIDNRAVELTFDNGQFESGVSQSVTTLNKLEAALVNIDNTKVFNSLTNVISSVGRSFSSLEIVAMGVLSNIATQAVNTGVRLLKSLSVDNISSGFEKYSEKTVSVATLVAQGYALETVNEQLDRLIWFTDETSYNFTDMVNTISKFTASGRDLESSVDAMEGIALWAALSGQNATTASRAMYQLAQAMSAGFIRKNDWQSIQSANMDTAEFRQHAIEAAEAVGTLTKKVYRNGKVTYKTNSKVTKMKSLEVNTDNFVDTLTTGGWFTSDVMMKVFEEYASAVDDIYAYAEEHGITASQAVEELGDSLDEFAKKAFLAGQEARTWGDTVNSIKDAVATGWMTTFEHIFGDEEESVKLWTDLANKLWDVFMAGAEVRNAALAIWKSLGGRDLLFGDDGALWAAFDSIATIIEPISKAFNDIFNEGRDTDETIAHLADVFMQASHAIKDFFVNLALTDEQSETLNSVFETIAILIRKIINSFKDIGLVTEPIGRIIHTLSTKFIEFVTGLKEGDGPLSDATTGFELFHTILEKVGEILSGLADKIESFDFSSIKIPFANSDINIVDGIKAAFTGFGEVLKWVGKILSPVKDAIKNTFEALHNMSLFDVIKSVEWGTFFYGLIKGFMSFINMVWLWSDFLNSNFTDVIWSVKEALNSFTMSNMAVALKEVATSVLMLGAAIFLFALAANMPGFGVAVTTMLGAMAALYGFVQALSADTIKSSIMMVAPALLALGAALLFIALAVAIFAATVALAGWENAIIGFIGAMIAMLALGAIAEQLGSVAPKMALAAAGLMALGAALILVAIAAAIFATIIAAAGIENAVIGFVGMLVAMLALGALAEQLGSVSPKMALAAVGLLILAAAMVVFAGALAIMAALASNINALVAGFVVFAVGLLMLVMAAQSLSLIAPEFLVAAAAMLIFGAALVIVGAGVILTAAGFALLAVSLVLIAIGAVVCAGGILVLASAIIILIAAVVMLSFMSAAIPILTALAPVAVSLAGAFITAATAALIFGLAMLGIGEGINLIGAGFLKMGQAVEAVGSGLTSAADGIVAIAGVNPLTIAAVASDLISLSNAMKKVNENKIVDTAGLYEVADALSTFTWDISVVTASLSDTGSAMVDKIVAGIESEDQKAALQASASGLGSDFIAGFVSALNNGTAAVYSAAFSVGQSAVQGLAAGQDSHSPSKETAKLGGYFGEGYIIGINAYSSRITDTAETMGSTAVDSLKNAMSKMGDVLNSDLDMSPVITPVVDMSNVSKSVGTMNSLFGTRSRTIAGGVVTDLNGNDFNQNGSSSGNGVTYNQFINSPKAVSRIEIYRQTRNLIGV